MHFHKYQHQHKAAVTKSYGRGLLNASEKDLSETVWAAEHLTQEDDQA